MFISKKYTILGQTTPTISGYNTNTLLLSIHIQVSKASYLLAPVHRNGSMSISMAAAGMPRSKAVITSGWTTPNFPFTLPQTCTSAHLPGKKVESVG